MNETSQDLPISYFLILLCSQADGGGAVVGAGLTVVVFSVFDATPLCPLNVRVGANSPSLWLIICSVT